MFLLLAKTQADPLPIRTRPLLFPRHVFAGIAPLLLAATLVCLLNTLAPPTVIAESSEKPNIVLIMADDLGYGDIGCFGNPRIHTPNLDQLAAEGLRFTDFHSSGAVCSPTRAGLMTGRYQQRAGIPAVIVADPKQPTHPHGLQDRELTFAELFTQAGYETAIFGKWHLGYYKKFNPVKHGFRRFRGYISGNVDFFSHIDQAGRLDWWRGAEIDNEPGYTTHLITKHSLDFINENKDKPFCLYIPYEPPHYPYQGPNDSPLRKEGKPRGKAETQQTQADKMRAYKEMVEEMDKGIGEIVAALKTQGLEQKTLVMFFSDNGGTRLGNNGPLRGSKGQIWEGGHRVPGIAWWPGTIKAGRVSKDVVITLDVMPTILALAGIEVPSGHQLDGKNLVPHLTEGTSIGERTLFWGHGNSRAVRSGPWKLVVNAPGQKQPGLFHLDQDLAEKSDLATQEPERVKKMLAALKDWEADIAKTATPQPDSPPNESP